MKCHSPFIPFPDGTPGSKINKDNITTTEASTKDDGAFIDDADKDDIEMEKGTKTEPSNE